MRRFIIYWEGQNIEAIPPMKVCADHKDEIAQQLEPHVPPGRPLVMEQTDDGICGFASLGVEGCSES